MNFERDAGGGRRSAQSGDRRGARRRGAGFRAPQVRQPAAEEQLTGALGKLFAVVEAYPELKATGTSRRCRKSSPRTENKIALLAPAL